MERYNISEVTKGNMKYLKSDCTFFLGILIKKGTPLNCIVYDKYDNNKLKIEGNLKDGRKDGLQNSWWKSGQLSSEVNFKNGKKEGVEKLWYKSGQLAAETTYSYGQEKSKRLFYKNGQLALTLIEDEDGLRSDIWTKEGELIKREEERWEERAEGIPWIVLAYTQHMGLDY